MRGRTLMAQNVEAEKCTGFVLPNSDLSGFQRFLRKSIKKVEAPAQIDFACVVGRIEYDHCGSCSWGFG